MRIEDGVKRGALAIALLIAAPEAALAQAEPSSKPNILFIMGDDIGWFNIGAYHQGIMSGKTPNLDKLASEGMRFTDYYAEASCTAGRANFITGELPIRTGMTTVGQAGADVGLPAQAPTIATALKAMGYTTGQFGKNHLGDLNKYLPCVHGFEEFFGYLYHLDAMSDPYWYSYPTDPKIRNAVGPRNLVHCTASDTDDPTVDPRWGVVGKQKIVDEGPLAPGPDTGRTPYGGADEGVGDAKYDMTTFDDVLVQKSIDFMKKAKDSGKPFFLWHNTTRMHVFTFLAAKYKAMMNPETNYGMEEAGMVQLDDSVGALMKALDDLGIADNTIVVFSTDNGAEVFTWPDGGMTPFRATKGTVYEGGFRVPAIIRWPGKVPAGKVENSIFSGLDWFPTFVAAAGNANIVDELKAGKDLGGTTYKVHLDGYNQTRSCLPARVRQSATRFGTSLNPISAASVSMSSSIASSISPMAGRGRRFRSTCRSWKTSSRIRSSGCRFRTCSKVLQPTSTTSMPANSGASSTSSRRSVNWPRPQSSSRRCRKARRSTCRR